MELLISGGPKTLYLCRKYNNTILSQMQGEDYWKILIREFPQVYRW